jgi:hypothetical protein
LLLDDAIKEGLVKNIDQDAHSFFPQEKYTSLYEEYKKIKIKHQLDMYYPSGADSHNDKTPENTGQRIGKDER